MRPRVLLLLGLAVLLTNFALTWGASDSQIRVLNSSARTLQPAPRSRAPAPHAAADLQRAVAEGRLLRCLGRLPELEDLTRSQVAVLFRCLEDCRRALAAGSLEWRARAADGASLRRRIDALHAEMRARVACALRDAALDDERLVDTLCRVVLASTG